MIPSSIAREIDEQRKRRSLDQQQTQLLQTAGDMIDDPEGDYRTYALRRLKAETERSIGSQAMRPDVTTARDPLREQQQREAGYQELVRRLEERDRGPRMPGPGRPLEARASTPEEIRAQDRQRFLRDLGPAGRLAGGIGGGAVVTGREVVTPLLQAGNALVGDFETDEALRRFQQSTRAQRANLGINYGAEGQVGQFAATAGIEGALSVGTGRVIAAVGSRLLEAAGATRRAEQLGQLGRAITAGRDEATLGQRVASGALMSPYDFAVGYGAADVDAPLSEKLMTGGLYTGAGLVGNTAIELGRNALLPRLRGARVVRELPRVRSLIETEGGVTFDVRTGNPTTRSGFAVADPKFTKEFAADTPDAEIQAWLRQPDVQARLQEPNAHIGGWVNNGRREINVSDLFESREQALLTGKARGEIAVGRLENGKYVEEIEIDKAVDELMWKAQQVAAEGDLRVRATEEHIDDLNAEVEKIRQRQGPRTEAEVRDLERRMQEFDDKYGYRQEGPKPKARPEVRELEGEIDGRKFIEASNESGRVSAMPINERDYRVINSLVEAGSRRQGVGRQLYESLIQDVERRGGRLYSDNVGDMSESAQAFWRKLQAEGRAERIGRSWVSTEKVKHGDMVVGGTEAELRAKRLEGAITDEEMKIAADEYVGPAAIIDPENPQNRFTGFAHGTAARDAVESGVRYDELARYREGFETSKEPFVSRERGYDVLAEHPEFLADAGPQVRGAGVLGSENVAPNMTAAYQRHVKQLNELRKKWGIGGREAAMVGLTLTGGLIQALTEEEDDSGLNLVLAGMLLLPFRKVGKGLAKFRSTLDMARMLANVPEEAEVLKSVKEKLTLGTKRSLFPRTAKEIIEGAAKRVRTGVQRGTEELQLAVQHFIDTGRNPATWYKENVEQMSTILKEIFPELESPEEMWKFRVILAASSNGEDPISNMRIAAKIWETLRGREAEFTANRAKTLNKKLDDLDRLIREFGDPRSPATIQKLADWMGTEVEIPVGAKGRRKVKIAELGSKQPYYDPKNGRLVAGGMPLGPKTGAFFLNIDGDWNAVTVDIWAVRTFRRWMQYTSAAAKKAPDPNWNGKGKQPWVYVKGDGPHGRVWESVSGNVEDWERRDTQDIFTQLAKDWSERTGQHLDPADVQAIFWYFEKEMYEKGGQVAGKNFAPAAKGIGSKPRPGSDFAQAANVLRESRRAKQGSLFSQKGAATPAAMLAAGGAAAGGLGQSDENDPTAMILGILGGAAAGIASFGALRRLLRPAERAFLEHLPESQVVRDFMADPNAARRVFTGEPAKPRVGMGATSKEAIVSDIAPDLGGRDFDVHIDRIRRDPGGLEELNARIQRLKETGKLEGRTESWNQTREKGRAIDVERTLRQEGALTGAEGYALRAMYNENEQFLQRAYRAFQEAAPGSEEAIKMRENILYLEERQDAILGRFIPGASETGRGLQALKIMANQTLDPLTWHSKALRQMGPGGVLTPEIREAISKFIDKGDRVGLVQYIGRLSKELTWHDLRTYSTLRRAGLLSALTSVGRAVLGNSTRAAVEAVSRPATLGIDYVLAGLLGVPRSRAWVTKRVMKAAAKGARRGISEMKPALQGKIGTVDMMTKVDLPREARFKSPLATLFVNLPFRVQGALDRPFRTAAFERSIAEQAEVFANIERLTGAQRAARVAHLTENPTHDMVMIAGAEAERAVFQNETLMSKALSGIRGSFSDSPWGTFALDMAVPFSRTPSAVVSEGVGSTPLGALASAYDLYKLLKLTKTGDATAGEIRALQREASAYAGRWSTLFFLGVLSGYALYQRGKMAGERPKGAAGQTFDNEGKLPYGIRIGDRWHSLAQVQPLAAPLVFGAAIAEAEGRGEGLAEGVSGGVSSATRLAVETPFFQGVKDIVDVASGDRSPGKLVAKTAASFVPTGVASIARASDNTVRQPETFGDYVQSRIPGLSRNVKPKIDPTSGEPVTRETSLAAQLWFGVADITGSRRVRTSEIIDEISRVGAAIGDLRREEGESAEDYTARRIEVGKMVEKHLTKIIESRTYQRLSHVDRDDAEASREVQASVLEREVSELRRRIADDDPLLRSWMAQVNRRLVMQVPRYLLKDVPGR